MEQRTRSSRRTLGSLHMKSAVATTFLLFSQSSPNTSLIRSYARVALYTPAWRPVNRWFGHLYHSNQNETQRLMCAKVTQSVTSVMWEAYASHSVCFRRESARYRET